MTTTVDKLSLNDWLDDLSVRFLVNLAPEELENVSRICFQVEEAQWFYEDFIRPLDPTLPPLNLRSFTLALFQRCHLFSHYPPELHVAAYEDFIKYKKRVPVRGAILLNEAMTEAVLVKGWKKNARWSFPRGKINKEEGDLACAVREVYEETGYDLHGAGLVRAEEETKKIEISIREQEITLFVFRGVPKDTHFEARTRKEISDIRWWKIADLLKNKAGKRTQQINGEDINGNGCYMVAPFIGPLKSWIREQRKLDQAKANNRRPPPQATDTEDIDAGDTTADDAAFVERPEDGNFANLIANLGRTHQQSDALPEVSQQPAMDPASELKRLLSVGDEETSRMPIVEALASAPANGLSALLHPSNRPPPPLPHTPIDQFSSNVMPPQSPHHHIPHPPANLSHLPPPPPFNYPQQHPSPFYGPQPPQLPPQQARTLPMPFPPHAFPSPPRQHAPTFPATHAPHVQHGFDHDGPYQHIGDGRGPRPPSFSGAHGPVIPSGPKLPPPKLTSHTLGLLNAFKGPGATAAPTQQTQHPAARDADMNHRAQQPPVTLHQPAGAFPSRPLQGAGAYGPSPPPLQSLATNGAPLQPTPRSAHHNTLLSLFRSPSVSATSLEPPSNVGPVELSAHPVTPGQTASQAVGAPTRAPPPAMQVNPDLLNAFGPPSRKADLTSATVTGPVNVPDFETVRKNAHIIDGHSRGPSPAQLNSIQQKPFVPQMILKRPNSGKTQIPVEVGSSSKGASPPAPSDVTPSQSKVFQPQILKRPQQAVPPSHAVNSERGSLPIRSPAPAVTHASPPPVSNNAGPYPLPSSSLPKSSLPAGFDRRESQSASQKDALLSLFSKAPQATDVPTQGTKSSDFHQPPSQHSQTLLSLFGASSQPKVQASTSVGPQPPTPKSIVSGVISPVSPLPDKGSQVDSPAQLASRSRISSIGDTMPPNIAIPKGGPAPSEPVTAVQTNGRGHFGVEGAFSASNGTGSPHQRNESKGATSPVNSSFLRGFLEDVARRGR